MTDNLRKAVALLLWHRFAPSHAVDFDGDSNRSEYLRAADEILSLPALSVPEGWVAVPREVVEPFARAADWEERCIDPDYGIARVRPLKDSRRVAVTLGECRAVRAALSAIPSPGGDGSSRPWPIDGAGNLGSAVASGDAPAPRGGEG